MSQLSHGPVAASSGTVSLPTNDHPVAEARSAGRLVALDAWRGLTILIMWLVNNATLGAHTPKILMHAPWGGKLTITDMVFPWFLFCAGAAIPYATAAAERAGVRGWPLVGKLLRRGVLLYLVGCFVTSVADHRFTLGLGVVQLIALASLAGGLLQKLPLWSRLTIAFALLAGYEALFHFVTPAGGQPGDFQLNLNAVDTLNDAYLTPLGLKGILSVIPTTALVLFGAAAADLIRAGRWTKPRADTSGRQTSGRSAGAEGTSSSAPERSAANGRAVWLRLLILGAVLAALGYGLSLTPVLTEFNKAFWTPSYILYAAGLGTLGVMVFYLIEQARLGRQLLSPLTWPGRNALFAYVVPILFKTWILQDWQVNWAGKGASIQDSLLSLWRAHLGSVAGGWLYTLAFITVWWAVTGYMARRSLIWKL